MHSLARHLVRWTIFGVAAAGAAYSAFKLALAIRGFDNTLPAQMALAGLFAITAVLLILTSYSAWPSRALLAADPLPRPDLSRRRAAVVLSVILVGVFVVAWITTPRIAFGDGAQGSGYGYDGKTYGIMTEQFDERSGPLRAPFCYRFLVPMLVHYSGLSTFTGFFIVNVLSYIASSILAYRLARHFRASRGLALVVTYGFATLKLGLKFSLYYPVQMDAAGSALLMAITYATLRRHHLSWIVLMSAATAVRENLVLMAGFYVLHELQRLARARDVARLIVVVAIPLAALALSRQHPVFPPYENSSTSLETVRFWIDEMLASAQRQGLFVMAYVNALGMLVVLAAFRAMEILRFLLRAPEWGYLAAATFLLSMVGGSDVDRFAHWFAPLAVALAAVLLRGRGLSLSRIGWAHWLLLHAAGAQLFVPWFGNEGFYLTRWAVTCGFDAYRWMSGVAFALIAAAVLMYAHSLTPRDVPAVRDPAMHDGPPIHGDAVA